jgi:hypothetical protein
VAVQEHKYRGDLRSWQGDIAVKPQSQSEVDFCTHGPLTGRAFAFSVNTHATYYIKTTYLVPKNKTKARHVRGYGLYNTLFI